MSDNKKKPNVEKPNGGDNIPTKAGSKGAKFADKLNRLFCLFTELKNDSDGAADYEKTLEENVKLKSDLKKRDEERSTLETKTKQLEAANQFSLDDFLKRRDGYEARLNRLSPLEKEVKDAKEKLQKKEQEIKILAAENATLKKKVNEAEASQKKTESQLDAKEHECQVLGLNLKAAQKTISFYDPNLLSEASPEELRLKLEAFQERCHGMVMACFAKCEAPPQNIRLLQNQCTNTIPITQSTSPAARLMRCAGAEHFIVKTIAEHIFTSVYFPGRIAQQQELSIILAELSAGDPRRGEIVRCQLLSKFKTDADTSSRVKQNAAEEIREVLGTLLPPGQQRDSFYAQLEDLLQNALDVWKPLQFSKSQVYVEFPASASLLDREPDFYNDYDRATTVEASTARPTSPGSANPGPVLLLFPLIIMDQEVISEAMAIWSDQAALVEAKQEAAAEARARSSSYTSKPGLADIARSPPHRRLSVSGQTATPRPSSAIFSAPVPNGAVRKG